MILRHCPDCDARTAHINQLWWWLDRQRMEWPDNANGELTSCFKCGRTTYAIHEYDDNDDHVREITIRPLHLLQPSSRVS